MQTEQIPLWLIRPSRWQPRAQHFDEAKLVELALSIRDHGLINPVMCFSYADGDGYTVYELIAGERRTRAVMALNLAQAYANHTLKDYARRMAHMGLTGLNERERQALIDQQAAITATLHPAEDLEQLHVIAVIENLDRDDLTPLEEARGYQDLIDAYAWSQRDLARRVHKSQPYVAQRLALLKATPALQTAIEGRSISIAAGRALATVPDDLQPAVTEWAVEAAQDEDDPATTKQIANRARQVAAFVDPAHWEPSPQRDYTAAERNRLRLIQWAAANARPGDELARRVLALAQRLALLNTPAQLVTSSYGTREVLEALLPVAEDYDGVGDLWSAVATEHLQMDCDHCIFRDLQVIPQAPRQFDLHCARWHDPDVATCQHYIGSADPVHIRVNDFDLRREAEAIERERGADFLHGESYTAWMDDALLYIEIVDEAVARRQQQEDTRHVKKSTRHVDELRAYWDWQQDHAHLAHFHAHACEKCRYYTPLNEAEDLPPCYLAKNPIGKMPGRAPEFALLCSEEHVLPRCEAFAYRELPPFTTFAGVNLKRGVLARWIQQIALLGDRWTDGLWGTLSWLNYGRSPGHPEKGEQRKLVQYLENMDAGVLAYLVGVALLETTASKNSYMSLNPLLDNVSNQTTWLIASWSFHDKQPASYLLKDWPDEIRKPWKGEK